MVDIGEAVGELGDGDGAIGGTLIKIDTIVGATTGDAPGDRLVTDGVVEGNEGGRAGLETFEGLK